MGNLFVRAWKGEASLAAAFWLVYVVFTFLLEIIVVIVLSFTVPNFSYLTHAPVVMAIVSPYILYAAICVWRCGKNSSAIWRILSRIVVVIAVIGAIYNIYVALMGTTQPVPVSENTVVNE